MASVKHYGNEIRKGKNPEENIPVYISNMASTYGEFALYNLGMTFSLTLDRSEEDGTDFSELNKPLYKELVSKIKTVTEAGFDPEKYKAAIQETIVLRETIKHRMEAVTSYVDELIIYEYILNRLEPKFMGVSPEETSNDDVAREILGWIFGTDDENALVNERIRTTMSCLPIRLTKNKIVDMVNNTFSLYGGSDKKAIDNFDYMLRSASGMYKVDPKYDVYKNVTEMLDELRAADYSSIDERKFFELKDDFRLSAGISEDLSDELTDLQEISNSLLSVLLTRQYFTAEAEKNSVKPINLLKEMVSGNKDYEALFGGTEERIEELNGLINDEESVLLVIKDNYGKIVEGLMLSVPFDRLLMTSRLCGESTFADLLESGEKTEDDYLEQVRSTFENDLTELLKSGNRLKNRAVMAQLLRELPITMSNRTEVMDYVRNALDSCTDAGERQISINLIRDCYD
ncbi:MAG: hypothetical protein MJ124_05425 [Lachnospiraceae bacterium]|nr:hypothetical protein [Lachnospiraceae bacterium]